MNTRHHTDIEWTHPPGFTGERWNPTLGCTHVSPGCANCYAERFSLRFNLAGNYLPRDGGNVKLLPERLNIPLHWTIPRTVFVDSMSDLFHEEIPFDYIDACFAVMALTQQHWYIILTKRAERMYEYFNSNPMRRIHLGVAKLVDVKTRLKDSEWATHLASTMDGIEDGRLDPLPNVCLGVSVENQAMAYRLGWLLSIPAAFHMASIEPMLGPIDLEHIEIAMWKNERTLNALNGWMTAQGLTPARLFNLNWVILGGESGQRGKVRLIHPDWIMSVRDKSLEYGCPFFFKQWGNQYPSEVEEQSVHRYKTGEKVERTFVSPVKGSISTRLVDEWKMSKTPKVRFVRLDGKRVAKGTDTVRHSETDEAMIFMSKKQSGAEIDGREWRQFPDLSYFTEALKISSAS